MIIKSLSRKAQSGSTGQLISYIARYVIDEKKQVKGDNQFLIKHNLQGNSVEQFVKQLEANEAGRIHKRSNQISLQHTIISFHKADSQKVTDETLRSIASKFIEIRGENNIYLGSKHENTQSVHIHLIVSATQLDGRSSRMSRAAFADMKVRLQEYQHLHFPELSHSLPRHGLAKQMSQDLTEEPIKRHYRQSQKETLYQLFKQAKVEGHRGDKLWEQFRVAGHVPYFNAEGKIQGIAFDGEVKFKLSTVGVPPIEKLNEYANTEIKEIEQLEELRTIRERSVEQEQELHAREFLFDLYQQSVEREIEHFAQEEIILAEDNLEWLDALSEPLFGEGE
jgi:hypothetical protein